jgi:uncharacterized protein
MQMARAEERGDTNASLFKRRLFWLLVIGLLHAYLLWAGDILSIYALMGFVLLLFRRKSNESLLKWSVALTAVPIVTYLLLYAAFVAFAPPDTAAQIQAGQTAGWSNTVATVAQGSYLEILTGYNRDLRYRPVPGTDLQHASAKDPGDVPTRVLCISHRRFSES